MLHWVENRWMEFLRSTAVSIVFAGFTASRGEPVRGDLRVPKVGQCRGIRL